MSIKDKILRGTDANLHVSFDVGHSSIGCPSRCDLVWQLGGMEAGKVIDVLAGFRFPGIQKPAMHVAGQSVAWRGWWTCQRFQGRAEGA